MNLKPVLTKLERDPVFPSGTLRLYIGNRMIGRCVLDTTTFSLEDQYTFHSSLNIVQSISTSDARGIVWIQNYVKESMIFFLKEMTIE